MTTFRQDCRFAAISSLFSTGSTFSWSAVTILPVSRRVYVKNLTQGQIAVDAAAAHHLRDVLRMTPGEEIEAFDEQGHIGRGRLIQVDAAGVEIEIEKLEMHPCGHQLNLTIASALPKGARADWMIEKLSELGVNRFVPLVTQRSIVTPQGENKIQRWNRLALESARQSRRHGVMDIAEVLPLDRALAALNTSHACGAVAATELAHVTPLPLLAWSGARASTEASDIWIFIGPEGGWEADELVAAQSAGLTVISLGETILRVETAAIVAAAILSAASSANSGKASAG